MKVLILGNSKDVHAAHMQAALLKAGYQSDYFDTSLFPQQICLSWQPHQQQGGLLLRDGNFFDWGDIHSIYWRTFSGVHTPKLNDSYQQKLAYQDSMSMLRTFIEGSPIRWVNSWQAYEFHKQKPLQLSKVSQLGVNIPLTLVSNDPAKITEFARFNAPVIFKPVYGGAHAKILSEFHLESDRLKLALQISPITLQQYIPGTNIRSYVIGKEVYTAEIRSQTIDFREDSQTQLIPLEIPENIKQQCYQITQALWLEWTAIDWRLTPEGKYFFLEANPSPMFIHFERQTGFPITQSLVNLLTTTTDK